MAGMIEPIYQITKYTVWSSAVGTEREVRKENRTDKDRRNEDRKKYGGDNGSRQRSKWGIVRAAGAKNENERDASIENYANADPGQH